jgi:hypothetical protein
MIPEYLRLLKSLAETLAQQNVNDFSFGGWADAPILRRDFS